MLNFSMHPNVYATGPYKNLLNMLEHVWVRSCTPGHGVMYLISGFANFNGGVRFYEVFRHHVAQGGQVVAILGGSTSQKLSSQQVVEQLLECGAQVHIINRKRILHAKCYGLLADSKQSLIVSSGNFTGPGISQNVESSLLVENDLITQMGFSWPQLVDAMLRQKWDVYQPTLADKNYPGWQLLYNELSRTVTLDETQEVTMILLLGHHDTARIQATPGSVAGKGTQYFWLSKDAYDFFPPLTLRNQRGVKATFSALITLHYIDLNKTDTECRVTFEAENNLDFRLGTGALRYTQLGAKGDIAAISRTGEAEYELRIFKKGVPLHDRLLPYAVTFIGHQGKKYGYISNQDFEALIGVKLPSV